MEIGSDIIVGMLSRRLPFKRQGSPVTLKGIPLPRFAVTGRLNPQGVFVVRRFDAPPLLSPNSLVVCLGNLPEGTALP